MQLILKHCTKKADCALPRIHLPCQNILLPKCHYGVIFGHNSWAITTPRQDFTKAVQNNPPLKAGICALRLVFSSPFPPDLLKPKS